MGAAERGQIKDKTIAVDLEQLLPALKRSLLTFLAISYVFSNTFSICPSKRPCHFCLHTVVYKTLAISKSRRNQIGSEA